MREEGVSETNFAYVHVFNEEENVGDFGTNFLL
jgi:hypothetical protein